MTTQTERQRNCTTLGIGVVAAIVTIQPQMTDNHRLAWLIIVFVLFFVEFRALNQDRAEALDREKKAREAENAQFASILESSHKQFEATMAQSQSQFAATMNQTQGILATTQSVSELAKNTTKFPLLIMRGWSDEGGKDMLKKLDKKTKRKLTRP